MSARTALLLSCSSTEAKIIREMAEVEHRTVAGYILNTVERSMPSIGMYLAAMDRLD